MKSAILLASDRACPADGRAPVSAQAPASASSVSPLPPAQLALRAIERMPEVQAAAAALARAEAEARLRAVGTHETHCSPWSPQRRRVEGGPSFNEWEAEHQSRCALAGQGAPGSRDRRPAAWKRRDWIWPTRTMPRARRLLALWSNMAARPRAGAGAAQPGRTVGARSQGHRPSRGAGRCGAARSHRRRRRTGAGARGRIAGRCRGAKRPPDAGQRISRSAAAGARAPGRGAADADGQRSPVEPADRRSAATRSAPPRPACACAEAEARRASADRLADPTVGVRVLNDQGGRERALGLVLSIPIGVRQRGARAAAAEPTRWPRRPRRPWCGAMCCVTPVKWSRVREPSAPSGKAGRGAGRGPRQRGTRGARLYPG